MFIGEAPGKVKNPDLRGLPFVGNRSSDLLLELIYEYWPNGYNDVYITNVVKCNPPDNRTPTKEEIMFCTKWLEEEIELVDPKVIVALGRTAANWLGIEEALSRARFKEYYWRSYRVYVRYHPAYVLRCGPKMLKQYRGQFKILRREVEGYDQAKVKMLKPLLKLKKGDTTSFNRYEVNALKKLNYIEEVK